MSRAILITGGSRSGKSQLAQNLAEALPPPRLFVATAPVLDDEMRARVRRHQADRAGKGWETLEEQVDLAQVLRLGKSYPVVVVDCLTLWVNNLMYQAEQAGREIDESEIETRAWAVLEAAVEHPGTVIFVTNEVGWGIVPDNAAARKFRDLAGRCNQAVADEVDEVILTVCGLPVHLKKEM